MQHYKWIACCYFLVTSITATAEIDEEVARASLNPLKINHYAKHVSLPLENDRDYGYGPNNNVETILNFKPIIPFHFLPTYDLIFRTIVPLYDRTPTPNTQGIIDGNYINGWGDINPTLFLSPVYFRTLTWGVGPTVFVPTATNNKHIGAGKWSVGPELAMAIMPGQWNIGFLTYNVWSVGGDPSRPAVNQFSFQYFIGYTFHNGWYINSKPTITADWKKPGNQQWLVPVGAGVGRAFHWGQQPLSLATYVYYNPIRPANLGPDWQWQLSLEWLFTPLRFS